MSLIDHSILIQTHCDYKTFRLLKKKKKRKQVYQNIVKRMVISEGYKLILIILPLGRIFCVSFVFIEYI